MKPETPIKPEHELLAQAFSKLIEEKKDKHEGNHFDARNSFPTALLLSYCEFMWEEDLNAVLPKKWVPSLSAEGLSPLPFNAQDREFEILLNRAKFLAATETERMNMIRPQLANLGASVWRSLQNFPNRIGK